MRWRAGMVATLVAVALMAAGCGSDEPPQVAAGASGAAADDARVSIESPADGATVPRRFTVQMAAENFTVEPAGEVAKGHGHMHVMVDADCVEPGEAIGKDDHHLHFGKGQMTTELFLEQGEHALCLQAADGVHTALDLTDTITVNVDGDLPYATLTVPEGETVASPVALTMEAHNVPVVPAGQTGGGHFHVMIDTPCVPTGQVIPKDAQHVHFGDGSTTASLDLEPGEHTLCLQMGDSVHTAMGVTHTVTVTVA